MMEKEKITITLEEYEKLLHDSNFLTYLEGCGVDNWVGYDGAVELFEAFEREVTED